MERPNIEAIEKRHLVAVRARGLFAVAASADDVPALLAYIERLEAEIKGVRDSKDQAYIERNHVVAALARLFPSGVQRTNIPDWNSEWHGCVYIDLPAGQISYHFHDSQAHLFADLPPYAGEWDGHDKEVVHARLATISSLEAEREWQPIETAPRDGTTILLIGGAYHGLPWPGQYLESEFRPGMPWVCVIKGNSRLYEHVPTHWRPLPAPPKEEDHG